MHALLGRSHKDRVVFDVDFRIVELTEVPFSAADLFVKWKAGKLGRKASQKLKVVQAEGCTVTVRLDKNTARWDQSFRCQVTMKKDDDLVLCPFYLRFSVRQLQKGSLHAYENLGHVMIDLSEIADVRNFSRKFLLQDSAINSALLVEVNMSLAKGDPHFRCSRGGTTTPDSFVDVQEANDDDDGSQPTSVGSSVLSAASGSENNRRPSTSSASSFPQGDRNTPSPSLMNPTRKHSYRMNENAASLEDSLTASRGTSTAEDIVGKIMENRHKRRTSNNDKDVSLQEALGNFALDAGEAAPATRH